ISAACRRCSGTPISRPLRCTYTSPTGGDARPTIKLIPTRAEEMFRGESRCNKTDMHLDPQTLALMALTTTAGWLMVESGVFKKLLDRRENRRICPSCGRNAVTCGCGV